MFIYRKNSRKPTQQSNDAKVSNGKCELQPPIQPEAITGEQLYHEKIYNTCRKKYEVFCYHDTVFKKLILLINRVTKN